MSAGKIASCFVAVTVACSTPALAGIDFVFQNTNDPGVGFNDTTPFGGSTLGEVRQESFQHALDIWSNVFLNSYAGEQIIVNSAMTDISSLGSGGPSLSTSGHSSLQADTVYPIALASHVAQQDLLPPPVITGDGTHIGVRLDLDRDWYYGADENPGATEIDFITIALHEIGHGLGFIERVQSDGSYPNDRPTIYDRFLVEGEAGGTLLTDMATDAERASTIRSDDLYWAGEAGVAGNGGERPHMYAPSNYVFGTSVAHLDHRTYPGAVMGALYTPGVATHTISDMELGILADIGWTVIPEPSGVVIFTAISLALLRRRPGA